MDTPHNIPKHDSNKKTTSFDIASLNAAQQRAVLHTGGPLLIIAGAGSGKTRTLTHRIAHHIQSGIDPRSILAITFTNKAANEMQERLRALLEIGDATHANDSAFVGTFHSWGARVLRNEHQLLGRTANFSIFDEDDTIKLLKTILKELDIDSERFKPQLFRSRIGRIKNELLDISSLAESQHPADVLAARVHRVYEAALMQNNAFDFDDLIEKIVQLFRSHPEILQKYRARHQHIFVDEYQDVNTAQYQLVKLLVGDRGTLSVVGDDAQSIYAFRGSDFRNFLNFDRDWLNTTVVVLEENYRSTGNILAGATAVIKKNTLQKEKTLWTKHGNGSLIQIVGIPSADEEAYYVTGQIMGLLRSPSADPEIAILYRTNAQSRPIEYALLKQGVPYRIYGSLKFYDRMEIKDIISTLQYATNPQNSMAAERIKKNFNKKEVLILLGELPKLKSQLTLLELLGFVLKTTNYIAYLSSAYKNGEERIENVNELLTFAGTYNHLGLAEFLEQVSLASANDAPNGKPAAEGVNGKGVVTLMTIHAAKGLEFNQVFLVGCNEGLLPHERSLLRDEELEEERRLMYVAMTRARHLLTITYYDTPSRFLYEIPSELTDFRDATPAKRHLDSFEDEDYIEYD